MTLKVFIMQEQHDSYKVLVIGGSAAGWNAGRLLATSRLAMSESCPVGQCSRGEEAPNKAGRVRTPPESLLHQKRPLFLAIILSIDSNGTGWT